VVAPEAVLGRCSARPERMDLTFVRPALPHAVIHTSADSRRWRGRRPRPAAHPHVAVACAPKPTDPTRLGCHYVAKAIATSVAHRAQKQPCMNLGMGGGLAWGYIDAKRVAGPGKGL